MQKELVELGLTEGEAKVYLAMLKLGFSTVGPIVKEAGVANSKVYFIIQRLIDKGLASHIIKEKTRYYHAVPPERLNDYLEKKEEEINHSKELLKKILPQLNKNIASDFPQEAEIFVGFKGMKTAYELLLEKHDTKTPLLFFYIYDTEQFKKHDIFFKQAFHYYRKIGLKLRGISTLEYKKSKYFETPPAFMDLRFVNFPLPSMVDIYKNKVLLTSWKDKPLAYLIHSREISENFRKYFEAVWKVAKR